MARVHMCLLAAALVVLVLPGAWLEEGTAGWAEQQVLSRDGKTERVCQPNHGGSCLGLSQNQLTRRSYPPAGSMGQRSSDLLSNLPPAGELTVAHYFPEHPDKAFPAGDVVRR